MRTLDGIAMSLCLPLNDPRAGLSPGRVYRELEKTQWLDRPALQALQESKLERLLAYAREAVPFYREYPPWPGAGRGGVRDRLAGYPILTKDAIRANPAKMHPTAGLPRVFTRATTGGTTGEPIEIWYGRRRRAMVLAATWRGLSWVGIRPWTRGVNVQSFGRGSWYGRLRMRLANKWLYDPFGKDSREKDKIAREILRLRPAYLEGFVSDTLALGQACAAAGVKIERVVTTGEMLYEHQRRELERLYGAKVSDYYGCNEVGAMAFECEMGRRHISDEHVVLEVVDEHGLPVWGTPGRILLTDLDNFLTPLVRYEVGDVGVLDPTPCPCGRGLTVLKGIEGRTQDAIRNVKGDRLSTLFFAGRFKDLRAIHRIQLVQRTLTQIDLLFAGPLAGAEDELSAVTDEIRGRLGRDMQVTPKQVDQLLYTSRGKCRLIIALGDTLASRPLEAVEQRTGLGAGGRNDVPDGGDSRHHA
jgi:phenylacetate-CoA ligase